MRFGSVSGSNTGSAHSADFREVFHNRHMTRLSIRSLLITLSQIIASFLLFALAIATIAYTPVLLVYLVFKWDPFKIATDDGSPSWDDLLAAPFFLLFGVVGGLHFFNLVKKRFYSRFYLMLGGALASIEGKPSFNFNDDECTGIKIDERYFNLDEESYVTGVDLEKLSTARGIMRIWYVPATGILVRAEWKPQDVSGRSQS